MEDEEFKKQKRIVEIKESFIYSGDSEIPENYEGDDEDYNEEDFCEEIYEHEQSWGQKDV